MDSSSEKLVSSLSSQNRVILLGGMAMLAHGFARFTRDVDIWLDPTKGIESWVRILTAAATKFKKSKFTSACSKKEVSPSELSALVIVEEMIRISGLDMDVDVFFRPNNLKISDFDPVWNRGIKKGNGLIFPDEIDLSLTKLGTGRIQDKIDIEWLDARIFPVLSKKLETCSLDEADTIFARVTDFSLLDSAMKNPDPLVKSLAILLRKKMKTKKHPQ